MSPVDGSVWGSALGFPGTLVRINPGPNPAQTALAEVFELPLEMNGYGVRGMDIDRNGVVWASLASGHLASFDRRKCKGPLNGPKATGKHCPEGWALYPFPGPQFLNVKDPGSAEASYYTWVDQFDTFGLGKNVPIATGNLNDGLLALVDGQFVTLRVPYPDGLLREMDGRAHRRSERRLERQRLVGDDVDARAFPHGRRQRHAAEGGEVPAEAGSAGALIGGLLGGVGVSWGFLGFFFFFLL